jgi:hypothetical protein
VRSTVQNTICMQSTVVAITAVWSARQSGQASAHPTHLPATPGSYIPADTCRLVDWPDKNLARAIDLSYPKLGCIVLVFFEQKGSYPHTTRPTLTRTRRRWQATASIISPMHHQERSRSLLHPGIAHATLAVARTAWNFRRLGQSLVAYQRMHIRIDFPSLPCLVLYPS